MEPFNLVHRPKRRFGEGDESDSEESKKLAKEVDFDRLAREKYDKVLNIAKNAKKEVLDDTLLKLRDILKSQGFKLRLEWSVQPGGLMVTKEAKGVINVNFKITDSSFEKIQSQILRNIEGEVTRQIQRDLNDQTGVALHEQEDGSPLLNKIDTPREASPLTTIPTETPGEERGDWMQGPGDLMLEDIRDEAIRCANSARVQTFDKIPDKLEEQQFDIESLWNVKESTKESMREFKGKVSLQIKITGEMAKELAKQIPDEVKKTISEETRKSAMRQMYSDWWVHEDKKEYQDYRRENPGKKGTEEEISAWRDRADERDEEWDDYIKRRIAKGVFTEEDRSHILYAIGRVRQKMETSVRKNMEGESMSKSKIGTEELGSLPIRMKPKDSESHHQDKEALDTTTSQPFSPSSRESQELPDSN